MCGITGIYSFSENSESSLRNIEESLSRISHRGPDHKGVYSSDKISLAHSRLSVLDLSEKAHQPMYDEQKKYVIIYNGQCYNHKELRQRLSHKNINFKSYSDTESVLYWLIEKGPEGLKDINGFFSLAIYDIVGRKLLIARDRFGIKPLFYHSTSHSLSFSSELKSLQAFQEGNTIDVDSLNAYAHLNYIPSPHSIFRDVKKLQPGTYLTANHKGKIETHRYFSPHYGNRHDEKKGFDGLREKIEESVQMRLQADVPLGSFLSGGLDSSIITGIASKYEERLKTYTLVFRGDGQYDESKDARLVSDHFGTEHHEIEIDENDLLQSVDHILNNVDEPFADSSGIAMHNLCKYVSKDVKVALSGDGGDELFAGYRKHVALYNSHRYPLMSKALSLTNPLWKLLPRSREKGVFDSLRKWEKFTSYASHKPSDRYWHWAGYGNPEPELLIDNDFDANAFMDEIYLTEIETFQDCLKMDLAMVLEGDMLVKTDRMSMIHGLEVRVPLLDHNLVEFVNMIPAKKKIGLTSKKKVLKQVFKDFLPKEILSKRKQGFEVPLKNWLNNQLEERMNQLLHDDLIRQQDLFDLNSVHAIKDHLKSNNSYNAEYTAWALMVFNSWWLNEFGN